MYVHIWACDVVGVRARVRLCVFLYTQLWYIDEIKCYGNYSKLTLNTTPNTTQQNENENENEICMD
jgi:hypothetical protein